MQRSFLILMYHKIECPECPVSPGADEARYAVDLEEFSWQMAAMREAGFRGVRLGEVVGGRGEAGGGPEKPVVLTFDDGNPSDRECALPVLRANGFTATFFVTGSRVGCPNGPSEGHLRDLCAAGMEVGSHGMTHRFLSRLERDDQERECRESRDLLGRIVGTPVRFFSLPGGRYTKETLGILETHSYEAVCTSVIGYNRPGGDPFRLKRIPVLRSTSRREFLGYLNRTPSVVFRACAAERSRAAARRILGERLYLGLRGRLIGE